MEGRSAWYRRVWGAANRSHPRHSSQPEPAVSSGRVGSDGLATVGRPRVQGQQKAGLCSTMVVFPIRHPSNRRGNSNGADIRDVQARLH